MAVEIATPVLLVVPAELCVLIYRYLIQNVEVPTWRAEDPKPPLRSDGQACCSSLASRQPDDISRTPPRMVRLSSI